MNTIEVTTRQIEVTDPQAEVIANLLDRLAGELREQAASAILFATDSVVDQLHGCADDYRALARKIRPGV